MTDRVGGSTHRAAPAPLRTARLVVRPLTGADLDVIVRVHTDPELMRHIHSGAPRPLDACPDDLAAGLAQWDADGFGPLVVELADGTLVGTVGFGRPSWCAEAMGTPDVGWTILQAHQRQGYATEAAAGAIGWFFDAGLADRLVGIHNTTNPRSGAVMQRLGMRWVRQCTHPEFGYPVELWELTAATWRRGTTSSIG
jgi:RimJ/RimL family protein N-acetyltransferase